LALQFLVSVRIRSYDRGAQLVDTAPFELMHVAGETANVYWTAVPASCVWPAGTSTFTVNT
jgi:hypothetical protein